MVRTTHADTAAAGIPPPVGGLSIGTRIQDYRIKAVIGEGGFSIVYLADDVHLDREVAIKEYMPAALAVRTPATRVEARSASHQDVFFNGLQSFINEAKILARFKHPSLIEVLRFWEENGTAYMTMPYYKGQTLRDLLRRNDLAVDERWLRQLLLPILTGLEVLHRERVFHRDISTDNIMVLDDGRSVLLDFGAARRIVTNPDQLATVILKPGFAPIEQYSDDLIAAPQGAWTDIYALSAVCYCAVAKSMPSASVARIMRDPVLPLTSLALKGFSQGFLRAIDQGMAVRPEERPQSIEAFKALLGETPRDEQDSADLDLGCAEVHSAWGELLEPGAVGRSRPDALADVTGAGVPAAKVLSVVPALQRLTAVFGWRGWIGLAVAAMVVVGGFWGFGSHVVQPKLPTATAHAVPLPEPIAHQATPAVEVASDKVEEVVKVPPVEVELPPMVKQPEDQGEIAVSVKPWGKLHVDGQFVDVVPPVRRLKLPVGIHDVVVEHASGEKKRFEVQLNKGKLVKLFHEFSVTAGQEESSAVSASQRAEGALPHVPQQGDAGPVTTGELRLKIKPWGQVSVDGRPMGVSPPLRRLPLSTGTHQVVLSHPSGLRHEVYLVVPENGGVALAHDFSAEPLAPEPGGR